MIKKRISVDAESWIDEELQKYKNEIISMVPYTQKDHEITLSELMKAKIDFDKQNAHYAVQRSELTSKQRDLFIIAAICATFLCFSVIYNVVANVHSRLSLESLSLIMTIVALCMSLLALVAAFFASSRRQNLPKVKEMSAVFMVKWNDFEWELKQKYGSQSESKTCTWTSTMQKYLLDMDNSFPEKREDFYYTLNMRNKIVHGELMSIDVSELNKAISVMSKLIQELR